MDSMPALKEQESNDMEAGVAPPAWISGPVIDQHAVVHLPRPAAGPFLRPEMPAKSTRLECDNEDLPHSEFAATEAPSPAQSTLSGSHVSQVQAVQSTRDQAPADQSLVSEGDDDMEVDPEALGHHERRPSLASAAASGFINFILMFGLCCAYGLIMFDGEANQQFQALGVKMNLCTAAFVGIAVATLSRIPVAIAGPDLNPVVFLGYFVVTISQEISASLGMNYPGAEDTCGRRLGEDGLPEFARSLSSSCSPDMPAFCGGQDGHTPQQCSMYRQQLVTTTIFAVTVSSGVLGLCFFLVGRFNLARYASFVPTSISEAFLSCVGYKVFLYALLFSNNDPLQFLPAALLGVLLFFVKARHWGNPAVVIPLMLMVPLGIFHLLVACGAGFENLEAARASGWMFPRMDNVAFWLTWAEGVHDGTELKFRYINFQAWIATIPNLITMVIVVLLDSLLKVKNTENKMPVVPQADYEVQLFGACNAVMSMCGAPVGYMQLKFNIINHGILGNTTDRRAGAIYAILCGVAFFWTIEPFNYMPRWFLSTLLFFAGAGFVAENLWGSRRFLSHSEWLEILFIVVVFIVSDQLIYAVVAGGFITAVSFISKYAKVPCLAGPPASGSEVLSFERHGPLVQLAINHIADSWFMVVRLKGFVFFASAKSVVAEVMSRLQTERDFVAVIKRTSGAPFSVEIADGVLLVKGVDERCVAEWNEEHPEAEILPGDHVDDVNGLSGDSSAMMEECRQASLLRVTIRRKPLPLFQRMRYVVFDCGRLDGMDASAAAVFRKFAVDAQSRGATCLWTKVGPAVESALDFRGIVSDRKHFFGELDQAVQHIERQILQYRSKQLGKWLQAHPGLAMCHQRATVADSFDPFRQVFETDAQRQGCPWRYCHRMRLESLQTVLWRQGADDSCLFLVHSGSVGIFAELPSQGKDIGAALPAAVYGHGWFLNREFLLHVAPRMNAIAMEDGEVLCWSQAQWKQMSRERPLMAAAIVQAAMRQQSRDHDYNSRAASRPPTEGQLAPPDEDGAAVAPMHSMVSRRTTRARTTGSHRPSVAEACTAGRWCASRPDLPHELKLPLQRLSTARALERLGLFQPPTADDRVAPLPGLPSVLREDVEAAFDTFCRSTPDGPRLDPYQISPALMFAGIFGTQIVLGEAQPLTETEFVALAHQALVTPLSDSQRAKMVGLFREYDQDRSGTLDRRELPALFESKFAIARFDEIDSAASEVDHASYRCSKCAEGEINEQGFLWIVGRLVRKHEHDFLMLNTLRELSGSTSGTQQTQLTIDMMMKNSRLEGLTEEQWAEMFWAIGLSMGGAGAQGSMGFDAVLGAALSQATLQANLPPFDAQKLRRKKFEVSATPQSAVELATKLVVDPRISTEHAIACQSQQCLQDTLQAQTLQHLLTNHVVPTHTTVQEMFEHHNEGPRASYTSHFRGIPEEDLRVRAKFLLLLEANDSCQQAQTLSKVLAGAICFAMFATFLETFLATQDMISFTFPWQWVELGFTVIFTLELLVRLWACSALGAGELAVFFMKISNLLDIVAVSPFYVRFILPGAGSAVQYLHLFRVARLVRISRAKWVRRLARRFTLVGPVATVLIVIWGIYLKETAGGEEC